MASLARSETPHLSRPALGRPARTGRYDLSFDLSEPEAYRRDAPTGHFALDKAADEIAALVRGFVGSSRLGGTLAEAAMRNAGYY